MAGKPPQQRSSYRLDENIGSESRSVEFKAGPGFIQNYFRANVAKYVCGFINSGENGSLLLGVEDSGSVRGYNATHNEMDRLIKEIDEAFKDIQPDVFPNDYAVHFVPILDATGNQQISNQWVIEISVGGQALSLRGKNQLFETKQGVYMRRDGSLQGPLSAQKIQEWSRRQFQSESDKLKKDVENFRRELHTKQKHYENKDSQIARREEDLARREQDIQNQLVQLESLTNQNQQLKSENDSLKNAGSSVQQELGEIKQILTNQGQKQSKVCVVQ